MSECKCSGLTVGDNINRLIPYRPGKPIEEVKRELGLTEVIKLASNENPLGASAKVQEAICEAAKQVHLYPDGACFELREAMSAHLGVPGDHLIFGNGSDELIELLGLTFLKPGDELLQGDPSFVRYESAAILNEAPCIKINLKNWVHDVRAIAEAITPKTRLIYIANPNNPTGTIITHQELAGLLGSVPKRAIVVMDEAYYEYVENPDAPRTLDLVKEGYNVIALRTFSKAYALAGLRIGYGIAKPEIIHYLNQVREPFNVNLIAQAAAVAALNDNEHLQLTLKTNSEGKQLFYETFEEMGLPYTKSEGNFVWVDVKRDCNEVFQMLLRLGVITRTGDIFGAPTHLRVTIGAPEENEKFLAALNTVLL